MNEPTRTLATISSEERDRAEVRPVEPALLAESLRGRGLHFPEELLEEARVALSSAPVVLLSGPPGVGKTTLATALAAHATRAHRDRSHEVVVVDPGWSSPADLIGSWDAGTRSYHATPFLEMWLQALRHKARPHLIVLEGVDLAPTRRYLAGVLAALHGVPMRLHADHLRCQPRAGLDEDLRNFFICHRDCSECFFLVEGYPQGVTGAVKDFVPAQVQFPPNLTLLATLTGPLEEVDPRLLDVAALLELEAAPLAALLEGMPLPHLQRHRGAVLAAAGVLEAHGIVPSPRTWCDVDRLVGEGVALRRALTVRCAALASHRDGELRSRLAAALGPSDQP